MLILGFTFLKTKQKNIMSYIVCTNKNSIAEDLKENVLRNDSLFVR